MEEVLVNRPKDPLQCLIDFMSRDESNGDFLLASKHLVPFIVRFVFSQHSTFSCLIMQLVCGY